MQQLAESVIEVTEKVQVQGRASKSNNARYASPLQEFVYKNRPYLMRQKGKNSSDAGKTGESASKN